MEEFENAFSEVTVCDDQPISHLNQKLRVNQSILQCWPWLKARLMFQNANQLVMIIFRKKLLVIIECE